MSIVRLKHVKLPICNHFDLQFCAVQPAFCLHFTEETQLDAERFSHLLESVPGNRASESMVVIDYWNIPPLHHRNTKNRNGVFLFKNSVDVSVPRHSQSPHTPTSSLLAYFFSPSHSAGNIRIKFDFSFLFLYDQNPNPIKLQNHRVWELEGACEITSHFSSADRHWASR